MATVAQPSIRGAMQEYVIAITVILAYTGMVLPQEMALSLAHLLYKARGVLARNLYMMWKMTKPTT
jgi:hypothetical protein